jgi:hypothetical protein
LKGRVLLMVEALFLMPLAIMCAVPTLGAIHHAWLCFGLNTAFLIAALLALLALFTVGALGIVLLYVAASALQDAIYPRNEHVPCNEVTFCVRTIVFVACLFIAVDIMSLSCWHRHLWQPMTLKAPIDSRFKEAEENPNISLTTAESATIKEGVRLVFPRYHGTHRYWIYVDNEIVGKVIVEANTNLEMSETGNLLHLSSRSGDLLLTVDHEQELPIHYPGGVGLFGESLPTLAYDDPKLFQCFEFGRNAGTYSIEIVELVDARFARYHNRRPLDVVFRKDVIVNQGSLSSCYTQYSNRQYPPTVMPAKPYFATAQQRADNELQQAKSALRRFESDPLVQAVKQFQASGSDRLMLDLSDVSLGTREIDTEQIYHFARWISAKYNARVTQ